MTDHSPSPDAFYLPVPADPAIPGGSQQWPLDQQPSLEQGLALLAWLQSSQNLSSQSTGHICDALLQWAMLGERWPDPAEPLAGPDCDHLDLLVQVSERLSWRIHDAQPACRKFRPGPDRQGARKRDPLSA